MDSFGEEFAEVLFIFVAFLFDVSDALASLQRWRTEHDRLACFVRVEGRGLRVEGLRVKGLGFRVEGFGV
jgi:hypothetical protein